MSASREPVVSALRRMLRVATSPRWICSKMSSRRAPDGAAASRPRLATRCQCSRFSATDLAVRSSGATTKPSPASATSLRPSTCTGIDGPASLTCSPRWSMRARTRPQAGPATSGSPTLRVPRCTSSVATGPRPMSRCDSSTTPAARPSGLALRSSTSATRRSVSRRSSTPSPLSADTGIISVSPPQSCGTRPCSESCCFTRSGWACSRSILLMATTIGAPDALAWLSASIVWGITPSSAATTSTTMSVASAPRARMAVNASWPGVSMKVMSRSFLTAW